MKKWIFLAAALAVMGLIFYFSAQAGEASYALSEVVSEKVQHSTISGMAPAVFDGRSNANMRKWAHVYIYVALGASTAATVYAFSERRKHKKWYWITVTGIAAAICLVYAIGDEFHQYFVPERAALVSDVFIDAIGFIPGTILAVCACYAAVRFKKKANE